ncbi:MULTISPECIES: fused MFS/spermidine synthase [unclassified Roseateles]|uniref:fused MFS/spermidine synthase n=1 Tax=unclassified Roseateles TaxID=2626991 RepID=UPI0012E3C6D2|nr:MULTISPECIES: fused MFS/spermidine synthase [unclassified Roseateles]
MGMISSALVLPRFAWLLGVPLALTVLLSAFLLFQVQPLMSKQILPWFGGSPSVWTTAMLFFQCLLFAGYAYAHVLARYLTLRRQAVLHGLLLVLAAALAWSILPGATFKPQGGQAPVASILVLLLACVGLPYFCLSTTGPLIQHWFGKAYPGRSPYRLYALSNLGSFLALLTFPYWFEPLLTLQAMAALWSWGFGLFALLCALVAWAIWRMQAAPTAAVASTATTGPGWLRRLMWVGLPALASLAFVTTTDRVSHDIAPEPRLWITTLSLYLLTFIICFDHERWYRRRPVALACLLAVLLLAASRDLPGWLGLDWDIGVTELRWSHFATMFLVCLLCHGELVRARPAEHRHLTDFYLCMSLGGACGGLFVALVATPLFNEYHEWPLCLAAAIALALWVLRPARAPRLGDGLMAAVGLALAGGVAVLVTPELQARTASTDYRDGYLYRGRNFYGTVSVKERIDLQDPAMSYRVFYSGQITHGVQFIAPEKRGLAVSYYAPASGVGLALNYAKSRKPSVRVGIVGMGIAALANYARDTDSYDFYEINPQVIDVAHTMFDNLARCRAISQRVILGDARLQLEQDTNSQQYDVLVLDAFSGGSVPIHLLTQEAFATYRRHLRPNGIIVVNITNGYLNLHPVVKRQAEAMGMGYRFRFSDSQPEQLIRKAHYALITQDETFLRLHGNAYRQFFDADGRLLRTEDPELPDVPLWTDSFSSINAIEIRD